MLEAVDLQGGPCTANLMEILMSNAPGDVGTSRLDEAGWLVIPPLPVRDVSAEARALRDELSSMLSWA